MQGLLKRLVLPVQLCRLSSGQCQTDGLQDQSTTTTLTVPHLWAAGTTEVTAWSSLLQLATLRNAALNALSLTVSLLTLLGSTTLLATESTLLASVTLVACCGVGTGVSVASLCTVLKLVACTTARVSIQQYSLRSAPELGMRVISVSRDLF